MGHPKIISDVTSDNLKTYLRILALQDTLTEQILNQNKTGEIYGEDKFRDHRIMNLQQILGFRKKKKKKKYLKI